MKLIKVLLLFLLLTSQAYSQEIKNITIFTENNSILISASLDSPMPDEIIELLKNGVKVILVYYIQILQERPFWMMSDKTIQEKSVKKIVTYNIWEKCFFYQQGSNKIKIDSEKKLQEELRSINKIKLISLTRIKNRKDLYIRVKVKLESIKLFPPLSWIYDLVLTRGFETSWKEKELK